MLGLANRIDRPELMDTEKFNDAVTRRTLSFLGMTARRFGGASVVIRHLSAWARRWPKGREISILDVGCGGGEIPLAIAYWAGTHGYRVKIRAIDLVPEIANIAKEACAPFAEIDVRVEDAFTLPGRGERFDYVVASLLLHHVHSSETDRILRLFDALSRRGVLISDLERSVPSLLAVTALSWIAGNDVVRHDGPLSVRRAFRARELDTLAARAGLRYLKSRNEPFFRLSLAGEKI